MSEYQTIFFAAVDKPLDDKQLAHMEQQSSRAEVSRWQFNVEYHYSDFGGNAVEMMRRGYDVHLHYANFGIRKLMFRLPLGLPVDAKTLKRYELEYCLEWEKDPRGKGGVLSIQPESDAGNYSEDYFEFDRMTAILPKIRDGLIGGDTRLLYLGWLVCNWDEDVVEPPVPSGLKTLSPELQEFATFHELDVDLLAAAASASPAISKHANRLPNLDGWLKKQNAAALRELMRRVLDGDAAAVRAESLADIRESSGASTWPTAEGTRTLAELRELANGEAATRQEHESAAQQRQLEQRREQLCRDPNSAIEEAGRLVETRSTANYAKAAKMLAELRDALPSEEESRLADSEAKRLAKKYSTLSSLKRAFKAEGLNYK